MDTKAIITEYLERRYSLAHKGIHLNANTLLQEQKVVDSVGMVELISFVEETFGIEVPEEEISPANFGTISRLVSYVEGKQK